MSNYCGGCRYDPKKAIGDDACPFTTLYWDFLDRHRDRFRKNPRMTMQLKNVERKSDEELQQIRVRAEQLRDGKIVT
jgi:deoxyribodipyrimidine photolyase-related protein